MSEMKNEVALAPSPKKGFSKEVYQILKRGPMTRQEIKLALGPVGCTP